YAFSLVICLERLLACNAASWGRPGRWLARYAALDGIESTFRPGCHARRPAAAVGRRRSSFPLRWLAHRSRLYKPSSKCLSAARSLGNCRSSALCGGYLGVPTADANERNGSRVKTTIILALHVVLAPLVTYADGGTVH